MMQKQRFPFKLDRVVGHCDVSNKNGSMGLSGAHSGSAWLGSACPN